MNTQNDATNNALSFWTVTESMTDGAINEAVSPWSEAYRTKAEALQAVHDALADYWKNECDEEGLLEEATHLAWDEWADGARLEGYNEAYDRWFFVTKTTLA